MAVTQPFGDKIKLFIPVIIGFIGFQLLFHFVIKPNSVVHTPTTTEYKADSLQSVIDSLQIDIKLSEDGFDVRESRYEDVIGEYEIGLSYLKDYHPSAYKDFHRIIGMKERYSRELEKENKQRLNINE
jgi:hypothetical protein